MKTAGSARPTDHVGRALPAALRRVVCFFQSMADTVCMMLVIGHKGYVGQALCPSLAQAFPAEQVTGIDLKEGKDCRDLSEQDLKPFRAVIHLGGLTNVADCNRPFHEVFDRNVTRHVELLRKLRPDQKYVYASTASVYGGKSRDHPSMENDFVFSPQHPYDATKMMMDIAAQMTDRQYYGLRFATVCGPSASMRFTMLNAMVKSAIQNREVIATNPAVNRPILCIFDLARAVAAILSGEDHPGIYNLASWNSTVGEMAKAVHRYFAGRGLDVKISENNAPIFYDFSIDASRFRATYGFAFRSTPETVIDALHKHYAQIH
jgi:nucleoside-diphosphate-sugar epimerase